MNDFSAIIGEDALISKMKAVAKSGNVAHSYLIAGDRRSGKTTLARCFAKALQCEGEGDKPCGNCLSCMQADAGNHPDIIELQREKPEIIGIDDIRRGLNDDIVVRPYRSERKVYLIDDADQMTVNAQNALLKTLEEPPSYAVIIMTATSAESLLPTILSRIVTLPVRPVPDGTIKRYLMRNLEIPDYKAEAYVAFARGSLGRAADLVTNSVFEERKNEAVELLKNIDKVDLGSFYEFAANLGKEKKDKKEKEKAKKGKKGAEENSEAGEKSGKSLKSPRFEKIDGVVYYKDPGNPGETSEPKKQEPLVGNRFVEFMDFVLIWYRDALVYKTTKREEGLIFREEIQYIKKVSREISYEGFEDIFGALKKARELYRRNVNVETVADVLLLALRDCRKEE